MNQIFQRSVVLSLTETIYSLIQFDQMEEKMMFASKKDKMLKMQSKTSLNQAPQLQLSLLTGKKTKMMMMMIMMMMMVMMMKCLPTLITEVASFLVLHQVLSSQHKLQQPILKLTFTRDAQLKSRQNSYVKMIKLYKLR